MSRLQETINQPSALVIASIALAAFMPACVAPLEHDASTSATAESVDEASASTMPEDVDETSTSTTPEDEDIETAAATSGQTVVVNNASHFCLFLPKHGQSVADSETNAKPFCTVRGLAPGAGTLPSGAVSAHEVKTTHFIQITGRLDDQTLGLLRHDSGGQYDNYKSTDTPHGSPGGAACSGHKFFVEQVEPDAGRYCIRCCDEVSKNLGDAHRACIENHSGAGCATIMPGANFR